MNRFAAIAVAVACGGLSAGLYLAVLLDSPGGIILVYLMQLPLFVAGLWLGAGAAAIAGVAGTGLLLAVSGLLAAAIFAALSAAPVTVLVRQALLARHNGDGSLTWYPIGRLLVMLSVLAIIGIAAALLLLGGPEGTEAILRELVGRALDRVAEPGLPNRDAVVAVIATAIPGVVAASWMVLTIFNGSLAQGVLARFGANWRPSPDLAALSLPRWMTLALAAAVAISLGGGTLLFLGVNVVIALTVPFCLAGLAVVHAAVRRLAHPAVALIAFYTLAGLFGWPLLAAAILGMFESWLGLRRRLAPHGVPIDG